jgi:two-component sensor histidine kinase
MKVRTKQYDVAGFALFLLLVSSLFLCSDSSAAEPGEIQVATASETAKELLLYYDWEDLVVEAPHRRPTKIKYVAENISIITAERVKNNMQVISSLLNLQSEKAGEQKYREMFNESKNRIMAMALIHEKLYRTWDLDKIDFHDYIESLANNLSVFYGLSTGRVRLSIDARGIALGIDTAIPCGLIINELLSNALKYAFPDGRQGVVRIVMKKLTPGNTGHDAYSLVVADNGAGMPESLDIRNTKSLGLHLVTSLAEHQLQCKLELDRTNGTGFRISFRESTHRRI